MSTNTCPKCLAPRPATHPLCGDCALIEQGLIKGLAEEQAAEAAPLKTADIKVNAVAAKTSKPAAAAASGEHCFQARAPYEHLLLLPFDVTPPKELTRLFVTQGR